MTAAVMPIEHQQGDRHLLVWRAEQLSLIRRRNVDLCVWRRGADVRLADWCARIARFDEVCLDDVCDLAALPLDTSLRAVPVRARRYLIDDVRQLATRYASVVGCQRLRLQLHTVRSQHCPRFHVDSVGVRLITTYAGPATEWIAETDLLRSRIGKGAVRETPVRQSAVPHRLATFDVALMKGCAWRGNRQFGVVHRSPRIEAEPRLVLTLDAR